jgi:hypothetical protein
MKDSGADCTTLLFASQHDYLDVVRFCVCYLGIYVLVRRGELGMSKITAKRLLIE